MLLAPCKDHFAFPLLILNRETFEDQTMPMSSFHKRFIAFCELNSHRRALELETGSSLTSETLSRWRETLDLLKGCYQQIRKRELVGKALEDPYFPLSKLRKLNVEQFVLEPKFADLTENVLAKILAEHLLKWTKIFVSIREDLAKLDRDGQVFGMGFTGSPSENLPEAGWCNHCGGCCEIRGGPPEFTGSFAAPDHWHAYFRGDGCEHQRFCPFLFEYYASGKFFCSIYQVKPKCCWTFDRDECDFLQRDVAREQTTR